MEKVCPVIHFDEIIIADSYPFSRFPMALTVAVFFQDCPPLLVLLCYGAGRSSSSCAGPGAQPQAVPSAPKPVPSARSFAIMHAATLRRGQQHKSNDF